MLPELKPQSTTFPAAQHVPPVQQYSIAKPSGKPSVTQTQYGKRRSSILIEATKDFCRLDRPEDSDTYKFKEFFYQFIENLEIADKRVVAAMLARMNYTPRSIALYLAMDVLEVAAPFLLFSPVLGESDLKAIGQKMGLDYKRVMVRRRGETLSFVAFPELDQPQVKIISKAENASEQKNETYITLPSNADSSADENTSLTGEEIMALASSGGRLGRGRVKTATQKATPEKAESNITLDSLYELARKNDMEGFTKSAAQYSGLDASEITKLIKSTSGDEIVYLVKALDFQTTKDIQLLMMLCPRYGRQLQSYKTAKKLLAELDIGICRMIFNQIGANFKIEGAPSPVEIEGKRNDQGFARAVSERRESVIHSRAQLTSRRDARKTFGRKAS